MAGLLTLVAILWTEENWRGKRDWENYKREWEAKGEKFDWQAFVPPPVPDQQNFMMAPIFAGLWNLKFDEKTGELQPRDTNIADRLQLNIYPKSSAHGPGLGNWQAAKLTDLKSWQEYYRDPAAGPGGTNGQPGQATGNSTNEILPAAQPQSPAADVLLALSKYEPIRQELLQASRRPVSRFPINYSNRFEAVQVEIAPLARFRACSQFLELHAIAALENGQNEAAADDVKLAVRFIDSLRQEPFLISYMVRIALLKISLQPVWEGLVHHRWTESQLEELGRLLASCRVLEDYCWTVRAERTFGNEILAQYVSGHVQSDSAAPSQGFRALTPRGMLYQNEIACCRLFQEVLLTAADPEQHRVHRESCQEQHVKSVVGKRKPYNLFAWMMFPAIQKSIERCAEGQSSVDLAIVACALERYRLAHGEYPETLAALVPQVTAMVPHDVIDGTPLKYRRTEPGQFVLYSVGWNGTDDGGVVVLKKSGSADLEQGDWVWRSAAE